MYSSACVRTKSDGAEPPADLKPGMQGLKFAYDRGERQLRVTGAFKMI